MNIEIFTLELMLSNPEYFDDLFWAYIVMKIGLVD